MHYLIKIQYKVERNCKSSFYGISINYVIKVLLRLIVSMYSKYLKLAINLSLS